MQVIINVEQVWIVVKLNNYELKIKYDQNSK